jgi:hypothetical protein
MPAPLFTVFTPTFNRAGTLGRVRDSLERQTFRDFEWLIVDDGSVDGTRELVAGWTAQAGFPIRYQWQENAGKHVAFNRGVALAQGELFLPLDSDDECVPHALEAFRRHWLAIPEAERGRFSAVTALCADPDGRVVGERFPRDVIDADSREAVLAWGIRGEKWGFHRTAVLREFPFPEPPGTRFVSEGVVWLRIAGRYRTRFVNEALRIYHRDLSPAAGALSALSPGVVVGRLLYYRVILDECTAYLGRAPLAMLRAAVGAARYGCDHGDGPLAQARALRRWRARALVLAALPLGWLLSLRDRRDFRRRARAQGGRA